MGQIQYATEEARHYDIRFERLSIKYVTYIWPSTVSAMLAAQITTLLRSTSQTTPIVGFGSVIDDIQASNYVEELRANLFAKKIRFLAVFESGGTLIGMATIKRNLNPNNRHIADLSKGMVDERFRAGGIVLLVAFLEIVAQCEADGVETLTLDVRAGTRAHKIWTHYGFETYGIFEDYARDDGQTFAGHLMWQPVAKLKTLAIDFLAKTGISQIQPTLPQC